MVSKTIDRFKRLFIENPLVNQSSFGDIQLYNNKNVLYPFVNIDLNSYTVNNYSKVYNFTLYVIDRNIDAYTAYNKCYQIVTSTLQKYDLDINEYLLSYFNLQFKDLVHGISLTFDIEESLILDCVVSQVGFVLTEDGWYVKTEEDGFVLTE